MKTIGSDAHRGHDVRNEFNRGELVPAFECPERADRVLEAVRAAALGPLEGPREFSLDHAFAVHDRGLVEFLQGAYAEWTSQGRSGVLLPIAAPIRNLRNDRVPLSLDGRVSYYCFDPCTAIVAGTWAAVKGALDIALTAADELARGRSRAVFGLCRPPGHHAARSFYGGYCFLNHAAVAAQYLRREGASRVTVLDIDYHHGNGTQDIFYDRSDVQFVSVHADPATDYPYFLGHADETGIGPGLGFNRNLPLARGADAKVWGRALETACTEIHDFGPDALVVSLGVDTFEGDPLSAFALRSEDFLRVGERIARLGRPTVYLLEGGYAVEEIGTNVVNVLRGHVGG